MLFQCINLEVTSGLKAILLSFVSYLTLSDAHFGRVFESKCCHIKQSSGFEMFQSHVNRCQTQEFSLLI